MKTTDPEIIYNWFSEKSESGHIATQETIEKIVDLVKDNKIKSVLEIGSGIGTLTYAVLSNCNAYVTAYEPNDVCIEQLKKNLEGFNGYEIVQNWRELPPRKQYDLIIVDGGAGVGSDFGFPRLIYAYLQYLEDFKYVLVEGYREAQNAFTQKAIGQRFKYEKLEQRKKGKGFTLYTCTKTNSKLRKVLNLLK